MKKFIKIGFPIACIAVIGGTFILLNKTTERISQSRLKEDDDEDIVQEEVLEENNVSDGIIIDQENNEVILDTEATKAREEKNKNKALELVKKLAPTETNCYYTNEGMVNDKYLVAIRDSKTKDAKIYYSVDIESEEIEIYVK